MPVPPADVPFADSRYLDVEPDRATERLRLSQLLGKLLARQWLRERQEHDQADAGSTATGSIRHRREPRKGSISS
jgi:hypothetical protein